MCAEEWVEAIYQDTVSSQDHDWLIVDTVPYSANLRDGGVGFLASVAILLAMPADLLQYRRVKCF